MLPFGRGKTSAVAAYDTARVMAAILADPFKHIGKVYHLTGPVSQDLDGVAHESPKRSAAPLNMLMCHLDGGKSN